MKRVDPSDLLLRPFHLLDKEWALLVAGTARPNPMTVSWGGFGTLWNRPTATVYVRPTRFTFGLLESGDAFTLSVLPAPLKAALELCGTRSGRDLDKWGAAGLVPRPGAEVAVPFVAESELALECRLMASLRVDPTRFRDASLEGHYPLKDYHTAYLGEVVAAWATPRFLKG